MFVRRDVTDAPIIHSEDRGVNTKEWIEVDGREALFKETQVKEDSGDSTYADYAESIVSDICRVLGVPCADVDLVVKDGKIGCLSYNFCDPVNEELISIGNVIQNTRLHFDSKSMIDTATKECYGISMILEGLESISRNRTQFSEAKRRLLIDILTDSLVDHYDRNPSNLSVISTIGGIHLSPKYDNGTSLSISVPEFALQKHLSPEYTERQNQINLRDNVHSKIGYLGKKFVKYPELETYIFNYYFDDVKDFVSGLGEKLTDEKIDEILSQEKYQDLPEVHKKIIAAKLRTNRDMMQERFRTVSKKNIIDRIIYSKAAKSNFLKAVEKGTIQEIIPEYSSCIGVKDEDTDYSETLDSQIPEKIQTIVDIEGLARYFGVPIDILSKREKSLLKWNTIIENLQKANKGRNVLEEITGRLGFLPDDIKLMKCIIKDKFKDEFDVLEARDIIYGKNGIGEENINLYIAKKFVDAAVMRKDIRDERIESLKNFIRTMREAVELEHISKEKTCIKTRALQKMGLTDERDIVAVHFAVAKAYRENPRITNSEMTRIANSLVVSKLQDYKEEILPGVFADKSDVEEVRRHTHKLKDGKTLVLFKKNTRLSKLAMRMGTDYFGQIIDHPSGNGVTAYFVGKKGLDFPEGFTSYAESFQKKYEGSFKPDSIKFKKADSSKAVACFIISNKPDESARIPDVTTEKFEEQVLKLFGGRAKEKEQQIYDD